MTDTEQKVAAQAFADRWKGRGYERGESQKFWLELLHDVYGVENATEYINFEEKVRIDRTGFIDGMIPTTKVMIEQKALGKNLRAAIRQSDGSLKTPYEQARSYIADLPSKSGQARNGKIKILYRKSKMR